MRSGPAPEIIEIIDDDMDSGGGRPTSHVTVPDTRSRWVGLVSVATLVAAIGYGVVSSAISSRASKTQPPPPSLPRTTTATSTTEAAPKATLINPQFYVADPVPDGFTMHFAETLGMGGNPADFTDATTAQLWATQGATANTGAWFVVSRGTHHSTGRNAYRTLVGDVEVVVEHDPSSGQARLSFIKDGKNLEITAFGWADQQLLRLVDSVYVQDSAIRFHDVFFVSDHKPLLYADPSNAVYGLPVAWLGYTSALPASMTQSFTITVAGYPTSNRDVAIRFAVTDISTIKIGLLPGTIGRLAADPRQVIIQWGDGDRLITMRGNLDPQLLASIAQTVHPGSDADVTQQVDAGAQSIPPALDVGRRHTVGTGWLAGPWIVQVSTRSAADPTPPFVWWIAQPSDPAAPTEARLSLAGSGPSIETFVEQGRTYVLARVPQSMAGARLHVNRTGLPSVELELLDVDAGIDEAFAAYAFSEPVPYTAEIVDSDGQAVASWPLT